MVVRPDKCLPDDVLYGPTFPLKNTRFVELNTFDLIRSTISNSFNALLSFISTVQPDTMNTFTFNICKYLLLTSAGHVKIFEFG